MLKPIIILFVLSYFHVTAIPSVDYVKGAYRCGGASPCARSTTPAPATSITSEEVSRAIEAAVAAAITLTPKNVPTVTPAPTPSPMESSELASVVTAAVKQALKEFKPQAAAPCDCGEHAASAVATVYQQTVQSLTQSLAEMTQRVIQLTLMTTPAPPYCVSGYEYSNVTRGCYKFHDERVHWLDANTTCHEEGGILAVINSREEALVLRDIRRRGRLSAFIGVYKNFAGNWTTVIGEDVVAAAGYDVWHEGEPQTGHMYRYGMMYKDGTIGVGDSGGNATQSFICERAAAA